MRPGQKLTSRACQTQVVVVRAPDGEVELTCGGLLMTEVDTVDSDATPQPGHDEGTALGKRYVASAVGLEVLCSRAGTGSLAVDGELMTVKEAKALPASD